jgi:hypothetical protein
MVRVLQLVRVIAQLNGLYSFDSIILLIDLNLGMEHDVKYLFVHLHAKTLEIVVLQVFVHAISVGQAVIVRLVSSRYKIKFLQDLFVCDSKNSIVDI